MKRVGLCIVIIFVMFLVVNNAYTKSGSLGAVIEVAPYIKTHQPNEEFKINREGLITISLYFANTPTQIAFKPKNLPAGTTFKARIINDNETKDEILAAGSTLEELAQWRPKAASGETSLEIQASIPNLSKGSINEDFVIGYTVNILPYTK
jgi:hypothetical protein